MNLKLRTATLLTLVTIALAGPASAEITLTFNKVHDSQGDVLLGVHLMDIDCGDGTTVTGFLCHGDVSNCASQAPSLCRRQSAPGGPQARKGMTWGLDTHTPNLGTDRVACRAGGADCDPYRGDTSCNEALPILCLRTDGSPNPGVPAGSKWLGWAAGHLATTLPVQGSSLGSYPAANAICRDHFGEGWKMAQFHDGTSKRGWKFEAFGHVRADTRFWVYIRDQKANCWN